MTDAEARQRAVTDLEGSFLVEAAAGTGKTTLIVERVAALVESHVPLSQIAAITFTEKAAGELKMRIRRKLETMAAAGSMPATEALRDVEAASISTIHAFCSSMLRSAPVEAGIDPSFRVMQERERLDLLETLWARWLTDELTQGVAAMEPALELPFAVEWWVRNLGNVARFMVAHADQLDGLPTRRDDDPWRNLVAAVEPLIEELVGLAPMCRDPSDRLRVRIDGVLQALTAAAEMNPDQRATALFNRLGIKLARTTSLGAQKRWRDADSLERARDVLSRTYDALQVAGTHIEHNVLADVLAWLRGFVASYEERKAQLGALDFEDLLVKARNLVVGNARFAERMKRRYHTIILDEFQDTDPLQHEIATRVAQRLFLVGDPKQSIYAFRRADVEMYERAREELGETLRISRNFRSTPEVIDWVNAVFASVMAPEPGVYQAPYTAMEATQPTSTGAGVWLLQPSDKESELLGDKPKAELRRTMEAQYVARFIEHTLPSWRVPDGQGGERPAVSSDVAILFRAMGDGVAAYEDAFKAAGIRYVLAGGKRLYQRQEVRALRAVCSALDNPADGPALSAALKSPFFGASDAEMFLFRRRYGSIRVTTQPADSDNGIVATAIRMLARWHAGRAQQSPAALVERIVEETGVLAMLACKPDGDQRIANLMRLVEEARRGHVSFRSYVQWLASRVDEAREEGESPVLDPRDPAVRFLTIHKSKGLEFPIVVLADTAYETTDKDAFFIDRATGGVEVRLGPAKGPGLRTLTFDGAKEQALGRARAEEMRVFYVAATRARTSLVIPVFAAAGGLLGVLRGGSGFGPAQRIDITDYPPASERVPTFRISSADLLAAMGQGTKPQGNARPALASEGRAVVSVSELVHKPQPRAGKRRSFTRSHASQIGNAVHRGLQVCALGDEDAAAAAARAAAWASGLQGPDAERAASLARIAVRLPIMKTAAAAPRVFRELPFVLKLEGTLLEGAIDLVFETEEGMVIVDYKTDTLKAEDVARRAKDYQMQGALYALALQNLAKRRTAQVVFCFLDPGVEKRLMVTPGLLSEARSAIRHAFDTGVGQMALFAES